MHNLPVLVVLSTCGTCSCLQRWKYRHFGVLPGFVKKAPSKPSGPVGKFDIRRSDSPSSVCVLRIRKLVLSPVRVVRCCSLLAKKIYLKYFADAAEKKKEKVCPLPARFGNDLEQDSLVFKLSFVWGFRRISPTRSRRSRWT